LKVKRSVNIPVVLSYEIPFVADRELRFIFELKVFQSAAESAPVVDVPARARESSCPESERPFGILSVTGSCASHERVAICEASAEILPESDERFVLVVASAPERVEIFTELVAVWPERVFILVVFCDTTPERLVTVV
jgi:hypothetical protein